MRVRAVVSIVENPTVADKSLRWYSRAVGVMRARPFADPTSWRFQAAVHDYDPKTDPYAKDADPPPSASVQKRYFRQCQHASWYFLPWHRMYLAFFEQMVADAVIEAGGPPGWTLPYWDYSASVAARKLPWAFRQPKWPDGETNHLYVAQRAPGFNEGTLGLDANAVETAPALAMPLFSSAPSASDVQFGGPRAKNHEGGVPGSPPFGGVENGPHNHVHVGVGGPDGFMIDPTTAALDPIFWLHHANIDRLWEVWLRDAAHANPTEKTWLTGAAFPFFDARKQPTRMTPAEVLDTAALGYRYDDDAPPAPRPNRLLTRRARRPTLLGASEGAFSLKASRHHVTIPMPGDVVDAAPPAAEPDRRVTLHLENLAADDNAGSYDVYVNVPAGDAAAEHPERRAGRISLFGAKASTGRSHARDGFSFVLDISTLYRTLSASGDWDPGRLRVTFEPVYAWNGAVDVGRVSVNVS